MQKLVAPHRGFFEQFAQFRPFDPDCVDKFDRAVGPVQIDLGVARADEMDMGRRMILRVDDEPIAMRTVDDDQYIIPSVGFFKNDAG